LKAFVGEKVDTIRFFWEWLLIKFIV
jgi:hypothetical protein